MVLDTSIDLVPIATFLGGYATKFAYDELTRWREQRIEEKREKIEWYNDLITVVKEIKFHIPLYRQNITYFDDVDVLEGSDSLFSDDDLEILREALDDDEDIEEIIKATAAQSKRAHQQEQQEELKGDARLYGERIRRLLSQYPEDADEELLETTALLWRHLNAVGMIGVVPENIEDAIETTANNLIDKCSTAIEDLE